MYDNNVTTYYIDVPFNGDIHFFNLFSFFYRLPNFDAEM